jgi:hypothetical protein
MRILSIIALFIGLCVNTVSAQKVVNFSTDKEEFIKQLSGLFNEQRKGSGKEIIEKQFEPLWVKNPAFSADQEKKIIETLDLMLDLKVKIFPDFEKYILCLVAMHDKAIPAPQFMPWHQVIYSILTDKKNKRHISIFLETSLDFFQEQAIYTSEAVSWKAQNGTYTFKMDSVPHIDFENVKLLCISKGDSSVIHHTKGSFYVASSRFVGNGGTVNWKRAGLEENSTYAEIKKYTIKTKTTSYIADSVTFYTTYFNKPLVGRLTEKIIAGKDAESANYPKFESYSQRFEIENIVPGIHYAGGFTMSGAKFNASGTIENPAKLIFTKENKPFLIITGLFFELKPERYIANHVKVKFLVEQDSITHPDLNMNFTIKSRELTLNRTELGLSKSPYADTYHNTDLYFESMLWMIDDPMIYFGPAKGSTMKTAAFESNTFFSKKRFTALMGISSTNPLHEIEQSFKKLGAKQMTTRQLAELTRYAEEEWHLVIIDLSNKGFLLYDIDNRIIKPLPKMYNYILNYEGRKDYDILQFNSEVSRGENAIWNLTNNDINLKGIQMFYISDSQKVAVYPRKQELLLKKNRNLVFDGILKAGNLEFMGSNYYFDYEKFHVEMNKIDSCQIYINDESQAKDQYGEYPKIKIKSKIKNITGVLYIDAPSNKSGANSKKYPHYPYVTTTKNSFVDWESHRIQNGRYPKDKFYYNLDPFTLDSLDNFRTSNVKFNGVLVSAGIFEDINEPLILMDDNSLGFKRSTGVAGYPAYRGFSNVVADLTLNYSGLQGKGKLTYLTSKTESDAFVFLPDETKGKTTSYTLTEKATKPEVPKTSVAVAQINYFPKQERLMITTLDEPMVFFEKEATFKGATTLKPEGLSGKGKMDFYNATLTSDHFKYDRRKINADTSSLAIAGKDMSNALSFSTDNVQAKVDFDKNMGHFISNTGENKITFPTNQYVCFMDEFTWYMKQDQLEMKSSRDANADVVINAEERKRYSNFYSIAAGQDSLNFLAPRAKFDLAKNIITCSKINHIVVADAKIIPDSGMVVIEKFANMRKLYRAQIVTNIVTQYHSMFNAELKIEGRRKYNGFADMNYTDENGQTQLIHVAEVKLDTAYTTVAKGVINEDQGFHLSPQFAFYGKYNLNANQKHLFFDGGVKLEHSCENLEKSYFKFASPIDPLDIFIPVDTVVKDIASVKLGVGMMIKTTSPQQMYPAFLSPKMSSSDTPLMEASGFLHYDKNTKKFYIGSKPKIIQPKLPGNLIELVGNTCDVNADGKFDFHARTGLVKLSNYGKGQLKKADNSLSLQTASILTFPMDEGAMKLIAENLEKNTDLPAIDVTTTQFEKSLAEVLGVEKSDRIITEMSLSGQLKKIPEELQKTLVFADLKWVWDVNSETFHTTGPIGIASMDKKQVFKYVTGKIEVEKRKTADVLRLYIEIDRSTWYYFEYKLGAMTVISADADFNKILTEIKDDKKKFEEGKEKYQYQLLLTKKKRDDFRSRFPDDFPQ